MVPISPSYHFNRSTPTPLSRVGFTLIELLVVVGIVAVLAVTVILTLNPAELLRQARDAGRLSDMSTLKHAIALYQTDVSTAPLGSSTVPYLSLPDMTATSSQNGSDCSSLGFYAGTFHCSASSTYRTATGAGWIPLNFAAISSGSPVSNLPVDPTNSTSSSLYYSYFTDGTTWKVTASPESQKYSQQAITTPGTFSAGSSPTLAGNFPQGWVLVPGNSTFGTQSFWVMKYDAKCASNGTSLTTPTTGYQTYDNSSSNCTAANNKAPTATPDGYPIANVTHIQAAQYCASIGAHLLTNDEYMTIVTNAAGQNSNWSGGSPGSGYLYSGHNDNAPGYALPASADDTQGYYLETNTGGNQRRTFTLSNGSVVWDFAGNVYQHVARSFNNIGDLTTTMALPACSNATAGWEWCQYGTALTPYISAWSADVVQAKVAPPTTSWNSSQGVGQVYTYGTGANQGTTGLIRGGDWTPGSNAGAFELYLRWGTGDANNNAGFRCAR